MTQIFVSFVVSIICAFLLEVFSISQSPGTIFTTHVSYMEIYNDRGYDLLDPEHETHALEDLPWVIAMHIWPGQDWGTASSALVWLSLLDIKIDIIIRETLLAYTAAQTLKLPIIHQ